MTLILPYQRVFQIPFENIQLAVRRWRLTIDGSRTVDGHSTAWPVIDVSRFVQVSCRRPNWYRFIPPIGTQTVALSIRSKFSSVLWVMHDVGNKTMIFWI